MPKTSTQSSSTNIINPHFDQKRIIWSDDYHGQYHPIAYEQQFDDQWRLFLERQPGFFDHTGVETSDDYIDDRIFELTGVQDYLTRRNGTLKEKNKNRNVGGRLYLKPSFPIDYFQGKRCLDVACGAGRWTRTMQALGASVKSIDVSPHGLASTRRFNDDVEELNLFDILPQRKDLHGTFDFVLCWGVVMCTHDPRLAFANAAAAVKPGGSLYIMVYAPTYHASPFVTKNREFYHRTKMSFDEKLQFAYDISEDKSNAINNLDMLNTFYNWVIPEDVAHGWYRDYGFEEIITLNKEEKFNCGWHIIGRKKN